MICLLAAIITAVFRPRVDLVLENLALRQQVAVFKRTKPRPHLLPFDRMFWMTLLRVWSRGGRADPREAEHGGELASQGLQGMVALEVQTQGSRAPTR